MRLSIAFLGLALSATSALAGANPGSVAPAIDPTARSLTVPQIRDRAAMACRTQQARLTSRPESTFAAPCTCYARRTVEGMSPQDVVEFRATGFFNDGTRARALDNLTNCGLARPF